MESYCSTDITQLAKAMLAIQKQLAPATKDATNPYTRSRYATLNAVMDACKSALLDNGIWLTQITVPSEPGTVALLTKLTHAETGQYQASITVLPLQKPDCQGAGSAITYARRYALTAMLGMVTEDDDDGEGAKLPPRPTRPMPSPQPQAQPQAQAQSQEQSDLPQLAGVTYHNTTSADGRSYVIATGDTRPGKDQLRAAGFFWNASQKQWWRAATA